MTEKNKPFAKFRCGNVTATIWEKEIEVKKEKVKVYNTEIVKNYVDEKENWQKTSNFNRDDLPKVILVTERAYEKIFLKHE